MTRYLHLLGLLVVSTLTACDPFVQQTGTLEIAVWRDFDQDSFKVVLTDDAMTIQQGTATFVKNGKWVGHSFSCDVPEGDNITVARELPDESLEVHMSYFNPQDSRVVTCTKIYRSTRDDQIFPRGYSFGTITYPPPKGLFKVGMLEADLNMLPWGSTQIEINGDGDSEIGPKIYHYQSDNPHLPELLVTVYKGKVSDVTGGAEGTDDPPFTYPKTSTTSTPDSSITKDHDSSWIGWLFDLVFKK